eukprot:5831254-Amphidinium_carterae.1
MQASFKLASPAASTFQSIRSQSIKDIHLLAVRVEASVIPVGFRSASPSAREQSSAQTTTASASATSREKDHCLQHQQYKEQPISANSLSLALRNEAKQKNLPQE